MGSFAGNLLSGLFSWLRGVFSWLWSVVFGGGDGGLLGWMAEHWKQLALGLIIGGTVIDLTVYFFRWRPDVVWASWFRRRRGEGVEVNPEISLRKAEKAAGHWLYADGTSIPARPLPEDDYEQMPETTEEELSHLVYQESSADQSRPEDPPAEEPEEPVPDAQPRTGLLRRVSSSLLRDLREEQMEEDLKLRYPRFTVPTRAKDAYQKPAYPPGWRVEEDDDG